MEKRIYYKHKLAAMAKIADYMLPEVECLIDTGAHDFTKNMLTVQLVAGFMSALNETKNITVYAERPTFLDWLLRRKRMFVLTVNAKEILKDPPKVEGGILMYELKEPC